MVGPGKGSGKSTEALGRTPGKDSGDDMLGALAQVNNTSCALWFLFGEKLPKNVSYSEILSILNLCE